MDEPAETWLAEGGLSQDEFDQLVRLTARYVSFDLDQFVNWRMPTPYGMAYVQYGRAHRPDEPEEAFAVCWPQSAAGFAVIEVAADGQHRELGRWALQSVARLRREELVRSSPPDVRFEVRAV